MTYRKFSFSLFKAITGLLCLLAVLLSTPWGTQLSLFAISYLSPLQVEYRSGALLHNLRLESATYSGKGEIIHANNVYLQLHLRCLWQRQLCIDELSIASLLVEIKSNEEQADDLSTVQQSPVDLPFYIKMDKFSIEKGVVESSAAVVTFNDFVSTLSVGGMNINVGKSQLDMIQIQLLEVADISYMQQASSEFSTDWSLVNLPTLYLPFNLAVPEFSVNSITLSDVNSAGEQNQRVTLEQAFTSLSWFETELSIEQLSSKVSSIGVFSVGGKINLAAPYAFDLAMKSQINQLDLPVQLANSVQQITLGGGLDDLSVHIKSEGSLALTGALTVNALNERLPYKLNLDVTQFVVLDDLATVITPSTLRLDSEGDLNEHKLNLNSVVTGLGYQNALFELDGVYRKQQLQINGLRVQEPEANNHLDVKGEVTFGEQYTWDVDLNSTGLTLPAIRPELTGRLQGNIQSSGFWQLDKWLIIVEQSELSGEINGIKLQSTANIHVDHRGQLDNSHLALSYGDSSLTLSGYSDESWHVTGNMSIGDMGQWQSDIEGQYIATLDISGAVYNPNISMQGVAKHIRYLDGLSEQANIGVGYSPYSEHQYNLALDIPAMTWDSHSIENVHVSINGDIVKQTLSIDWVGESSLSLLLNGVYTAASKTWNGQINQVEATLAQQVISPDQAIQIQYKHKSNDIEVSSHCWQGEKVDLCLEKQAMFSPDKGQIALAFELESGFLSTLMPDMIELSHHIEGQVNLGWDQQKLSLFNSNMIMSAGNLQVKKDGSPYQLIEWSSGKANLSLVQGQLIGNLGIFSSEKKPILEANARLALAEKQWQDTHLLLHNFNITPIRPFMPELSALEGQLSTNITLSGAFERPSISGQASLEKGQAQFVGSTNALTNMNMLFEFNGQEATVAADMLLNQGAVQVSGEANWKDSFMLDMNIDGQSLSLSSPPQMTFVASPNINAKITPSGVNLTGVIEVHKGKLTFDELPQDKVTLSNDVIIVNDDGEQVEQDKAFNVSTDIRLIIADAFKVEGQGFEGLLGGELQVNQRMNQPLQLFGRLNFPSGRYRAYGQDLSLSTGIVSFNGPVNNPYITIRAIRRIEKEDIIVGIDATGLANGLSIKLYSQPNLQQAEALSYLVRGKGLDAETSTSNAALGIALGTAVTNHSGLFEQIEKLPFINDIELDGDEKQISIAGYLSDKVYIKYGIGVMEPINELTVRFYLLSRLWVEAVSGLESSADLYYSFEID